MMTPPPAGIPATYKGKPFIHAWTCKNAAGAIEWIEARYDDGTKKENPPFIPNGTGLKNEAPPAPRTLYGLDTLRDPQAPVFVEEGPKKAAALHSLGLQAVASLGGAQAAHNSDWTPLQAFKRVVPMPDADEPGEAYARAVVGIVAAFPGAREIKIARLPGLPDHGDVVDWLQARLPDWDGFGPIPREPGDDLQVELLEALNAAAMPAPVEWTQTTIEAAPEWEPPVQLDAATIPPWPRDVFPEPVQRFVDALSAATETPMELPAMMPLSVIATAAQGKFCVHVKADHFEPLSLWTCCALPSGNRKTAVWQAAVKPLVQWECAQREALEPETKRIESQRKSIQARIDALRSKGAKEKDSHAFDIAKQEIADLEATMPEVRSLPQVWAADCTPENLAVIMAENNDRMALLSDEGGMLDLAAGRYNNGIPNLDVYLQGHAGSPVRVNRGSRPPVFLERPALSIGICPQPDVVRALQDKPGFRGRGLLARFLYAMPESNLGRRTGNAAAISDATREAYAATVCAILDLPWNTDAAGHLCAHVLKLSPEALDLWNSFARSIEAGLAPGGTFENLTDWAGKCPGAVARIAAVLHVTRHAHGMPWTHTIGAVDMAAAIRLGEVLSKHALIAFDCMGADAALDDARAVLSWIRRDSMKTFSFRNAHTAHRGRFQQKEQVAAALAVLVDRGHVRMIPQAVKPGRPSRLYETNPLALCGR